MSQPLLRRQIDIGRRPLDPTHASDNLNVRLMRQIAPMRTPRSWHPEHDERFVQSILVNERQVIVIANDQPDDVRL